ncbi:MAG: 3D domain-containing protein [Candidatus Andersenbacteria bacterium]|nr:3D domain-containing protein [Candidatus Andersenbacteria bacterium]
MRSAFCLCLLFLLVLPHAASALQENSAPLPVVRLTIARPPPNTLWQRLVSLLGARRPAPGTTLAVTSTAYAPSPYQTDRTPCLTAAGTRVRPGTVAANWLPLGTLLNINGEVYIVEDRMHPRYQQSIDIFFPSTSQALEFGRRLLTISIIGYGTPGQPIREDKVKKAPADKNQSAPAQQTKQKPAAPKKAPAKKAPPREPAGQNEEAISLSPPAIQVVPPPLSTRARLAWASLRYFLPTAARRSPVNVNRFDVNCFTADKS